MRSSLIAMLVSVAALMAASGAIAQPTAADRDHGGVGQSSASVRDELRAIDEIIRAGRLVEARDRTAFLQRRVEDALGPTHGLTGQVAIRAATIQERLGRKDEARVLYRQALVAETQNSGRTTPAFKAVLDALVNLEFAAGNGAAVKPLYDAVFTGLRQEEPQGSVAEAILRDDWGTHARRLGAFAEAERSFRDALALKERLLPPTDIGIARSLNNLAGVLRVVGRYDEASRAYERAIDVWTQSTGSEDANVAILTDNLGVLYLNMGRVHEAERLHRRAVDTFERVLGPSHPTTAVGVANLAEVFRQLARYDEAEGLFVRAIGILEKAARGPDQRLAVALDNLGGIYRERGLHAKALETYQKALGIFKQIYPADHPTVGVTTNNVGLALVASRRYDEAAEWFARALEIAEKAYGPQHREVATQLLNIGELEQKRRRFDVARKALQRAIIIQDAVFGATHERLVPALTRLGAVELAAGAPVAAVAPLRRATAIAVADAARIAGRPDRREDDGRLDGGIFALMVETLWRVGGAEDAELRDEAFRAAQQAVATSAGRAVAQLGARLAAGNNPLAEKIRRRQDLAVERAGRDKRLITAVSAPSPARDASVEAALREAVARADAEIVALDRSIAAAFPDYASLTATRVLTIAEARDQLNANEALVLILPTADAAHVFAVTREGVTWVRREVGAGRIAEDVARLRCGLDPEEWTGAVRPIRCLGLVARAPENGLLPFDTAAAKRLFDQVLAPVEAITERRHLLVVTAGPLASLPLHVLVTETARSGRAGHALSGVAWLARRQAVTTLPSVSSLAALRADAVPSRAGKPFLGVANPLLAGADGDDRRAFARTGCSPPQPRTSLAVAAAPAGGAADIALVRGGAVDPGQVARLEPLPETVDEVCAIASVLRTGPEHVLIGEQATETRLKSMNASGDLARYRILHFATHGLVAGDLKGLAEPALVLTPPGSASSDDDGLLSASEVAALRLDADWVVLSACNTASGGTGDREALSGLARAFFYAGARALLVSHWPVQSDAAVLLTTAALDAMKLQPGLGRSEALRRAMLDLMVDDDPVAAHPQIWAPFVVVGEGGGDLFDAAAEQPKARPRARPAAKKGPDAGTSTPDWARQIFEFVQ